MIIMLHLSASQLPEKQGPAISVIPVLRPLKPFPNNLFVFFQLNCKNYLYKDCYFC